MTRTASYDIKGVKWEYSYALCRSNVSNVRWKTVPESTASSGESTIANSHQSGCRNDDVIRRRRS